MKTQKDIFKESEGDKWFDRNKDKTNFHNNDIITLLKNLNIYPKDVLEIGCSNGHQLNEIKKEFQCICLGIDPSSKAIRQGLKKFPTLTLIKRSAENLPFVNDSFDLIIVGFCFYLCDREDLFVIASEIDRCLKNNGTLIIKDFYPPFPYKNKYAHHKGIYSYKMDYSKMFSWNPDYITVTKIMLDPKSVELKDKPDEREGIIVLKKLKQFAYITDPFKKNKRELLKETVKRKKIK